MLRSIGIPFLVLLGVCLWRPALAQDQVCFERIDVVPPEELGCTPLPSECVADLELCPYIEELVTSPLFNPEHEIRITVTSRTDDTDQ
jgi:hypothetical protein